MRSQSWTSRMTRTDPQNAASRHGQFRRLRAPVQEILNPVMASARLRTLPQDAIGGPERTATITYARRLAATIVAVTVVGGCASADPAPERAPASSPSLPGRIEVLNESGISNPDAHTMDVITGRGFADSVASHAFNDGVVQVGVRGDRWTTDQRLWLCDVLVDEFRDNEAVKQILIAFVPSGPTSYTQNSVEQAPLVHWNAPDMQCVADPG